MTAPFLYGRAVAVELRRRDTGEVRTWSALATRFSLTYGVQRSRNRGEVTLTNLSEESRAWVDGGEVAVVVRAGYDPAGTAPTLPVAGMGDAMRIEHERSGPDWRTTITLSDGERAARRSRASLSYAASTRRDLVDAAARALAGDHGLGVGDIAEQMAGPDFDARLADVALDGPAGRVLDALLPEGWSWTVMEGALALVPPDGVVGQRVIVVGEDTGLVGSPKPLVSERRSERGLEVTMLLDASVRPGQILQLQSRLYAGEYVVREVTHSGDTHGQDWFCAMRVRAR